MKNVLRVWLVLVLVLSFSAAVVYAAALSADRDTHRRSGKLLSLSVAASNAVYAGAMVAVDSNGYAVAASADNTLTVIGRANEQKDNSSGDAGDLSVEVEIGVFKYGSIENTTDLTIADIGKLVYASDDQTVSLSSSGNTRPVAGRILDRDSSGVWVDFSRSFSGPSSGYSSVFANITAAENDADGIVIETRNGILPTDIVTASIYNTTSDTWLINASTSANTVTFVMNLPGGAGTRINYDVIRATQ